MTWTWENKDHNVNQLDKTAFDHCNVNNSIAYSGDYVWTAPTVITEPSELFYFACERLNGIHCRDGNMRAIIKVSNDCP